MEHRTALKNGTMRYFFQEPSHFRMIGFPLLCRFFVIFTTISIKTQVRLCNGLISFSYHPYFCIIFLLSCMIEQKFSAPPSKRYVLATRPIPCRQTVYVKQGQGKRFGGYSIMILLLEVLLGPN
jgi:hypothetical protein